MVNFEIVVADVIDCSILARQWDLLSVGQCIDEIIASTEKVKLKKQHTARDELVAKMGNAVLKRKRNAMKSTSSFTFFADNPEFITLGNFINLDNVICKTFDVITGKKITFPVMEWITKSYYKQYTLCLHGNSDLGKTQFAYSLLADLCCTLQGNKSVSPFFLKFETVDSVRDATHQGLMRPFVPILFDEVTPGKVRGTRPRMTLEDIKHMTEVANTSTVDGRCNDIKFHQNQPRILTNNAKTPFGVHPDLPIDPFQGSDDIRSEYEPDVKAVFKRTCFAHVDVSLISQEMRDAYQASKFGQVLPSEPSNDGCVIC